MISIGTSGFSYDDWIGPFYPEGLPAREQLAFYAQEFSTVEINTTYYRIPELRLVQGWAAKTPDGFQFAVKAFQGLTHEREHPDFAGIRRGAGTVGRGRQARLRTDTVPLFISPHRGQPRLPGPPARRLRRPARRCGVPPCRLDHAADVRAAKRPAVGLLLRG